MMAFLHSIRQWLVLALVVAVAVMLFIHFGLRAPGSVTLPGGQVVGMDTASFKASVNQILKKVEAQDNKVNELESVIRQTNTQVIEREIPVALKETDVVKSVARMKEAW